MNNTFKSAAAVLTFVGALGATSQAQALSIHYAWDDINNPIATAAFGPSYTLQTTNWNTLLTLPKFNIAGMVLDSAVLSYGGEFNSTGRIDSEDAADQDPVRVRTNVDLDFFGNGANGSTDLGAGAAFTDTIALLATLYNGPLAADSDGAADFLGADAASGLSAGAANYPNFFNITNLASVLGAGNFDVFVRAISGLSITGTANLASEINTEAKAQIDVTYNYHEEQRQVPEPAILGLMGLGLAGFAASRKKKQA